MRLMIAAIGKLPRGPERELVERYADRLAPLARTVRLGPLVVHEREVREADAKSGRQLRKEAECALLAKALAPAERIVALDERGDALGSAEFANLLGRWRDSGVACVGFAIGGADGLAEELRSDAALSLSLGKPTWPHALARAMLAEQLYRAAAQLAGHPYHREG